MTSSSPFLTTMPMSSYFSFLYSQMFVEPSVPHNDFTSQTIIITGANKGPGLEATRHLPRLNASRVILAVRSLLNGSAAKNDLQTLTGRSGAVHVCELDMANRESVRQFSDEITQTVDRLDAVILNVGIYTQDFALVNGHASTITVNVVNTFFLALLLLPVLRKSAKR